MHKVISLYTGAGGLDLGFEAAGFDTGVAVEYDHEACDTLRANRGDWGVVEDDIHNVTSDLLMDIARVREGDPDVLIGGPPCQPFSKSGYWANGDAKRLDDPRATTLEAYLRVLRDLKPRAFLLENVAGLAYQSKSEGIDLLRRTVDSINSEFGTEYALNMALLNAADYGVPQERERVFIIGSREGLPFEFPEPTHERLNRGSGHDPESGDDYHRQLELGEESGLLPAANAWDAIGDLEEDDDPSLQPRGKWAELLPSIPEGCNYLYHTERGGGVELFGWRRRYWSFMLKLAKRYPAWTITAQPGPAIGPFHWKNRRLSPRELARIQTFPDGYEIVGGLSAAQRQLGNAVPSGLAELLALEIRRQLLGESDLARTPTLLPAHRVDLPAPEPVRPLAKKYLSLIGARSAHPGTGQGFGAAAREAT